jgi:hypothetical protein
VTLPGTIDELIERSIPNVMKRDGNYSDAFIATFPRFCKGNVFINKLQEKWVRADKVKPNFQHRHIAKVLLEWTHAHPALLDEPVRPDEVCCWLFVCLFVCCLSCLLLFISLFVLSMNWEYLLIECVIEVNANSFPLFNR